MPIDTSFYSQVRPPQQSDPLEQFGRLLALKSALSQQQQQARLAPIQERAAQQEVEAQDIALRQKQQADADNQTIRQAQMEAGGDFDGTLKALRGKIHPDTFARLQKESFDMKKQLGELDKQKREQIQFTLGHVGGAAKMALGAPPDQKQAVWQGERARLASLGIELPEAMPDDQALQAEVLHAMGLEKWLSEGRAAAGEQRAIETHGAQMSKANAEQAARVREDLARANPDDPAAQAAAMTAEQRTNAQLLRDRLNKEKQPVAGRDIPLPADVEAQRTRMNAARAQINGLSPQQLSQVNSLASKFDAHPAVKDYNVQVNKAQTVKGILDRPSLGGPGDLAVVYEFMKALDPTSVVRESEYASAAKSGNIFSGALAKFNGYLKPEGGFLPPGVKSSFMQIINQKLDASRKQVTALHGDMARRIDNITGKQGVGKDYLTDYSTLYDQPEAPQSTGIPQVGETFNGGKVLKITKVK